MNVIKMIYIYLLTPVIYCVIKKKNIFIDIFIDNIFYTKIDL